MKAADYMELALSLAKATVGQTSPNPSVGAVVVKDGRIVGMGSHLKPGEAHAEVIALEQAKDHAVDSTVYVTLEPCAHYGKTPPCARLLVEKQVKRVVIASVDPNPNVQGKGIQILEEAGIDVEVGLKENEALELNRFFFHYMHYKKPFVTLKAATTLDGKIATKTGDSKWITSKDARIDVHLDRAKHDAILVGSQTVKADDPQLTVREPAVGTSPIRIVLSTDLDFSFSERVFDHAAKTWLITTKHVSEQRIQTVPEHIEVIQLNTDTVEINAVLDVLGEGGIQSLYVEGGRMVHASFIKAKAFHRIQWYIAPKMLTGIDALTAVGGQSPEWMKEAIDLEFEDVEKIGPDLKITARQKKEA
ncbi:diaminohydroxyphosphoribosylaminopyrimidine deaminase [Pelagirhabdus alkalitolerans]|uniref:Riboflavin biosynthesis protein RibD n=1 Tax=Pelagirhabdus alkalitolerans TaxID=1612202 RepID=A0A1G6JJ02_9BACI|nr:bifunctional diaminohydroxyphosphoribosylaminopyrimidine deaminase/5-amino-6-(5-phosphoribosylamino)uracil reductase RibD [Pelagirhabdus alkalitolerans]SDC18647.1 diaminohydroxyphosphoribosylaminopyrimidine deaminase [Pelagirhabdus alkalitolerans]